MSPPWWAPSPMCPSQRYPSSHPNLAKRNYCSPSLRRRGRRNRKQVHPSQRLRSQRRLMPRVPLCLTNLRPRPPLPPPQPPRSLSRVRSLRRPPRRSLRGTSGSGLKTPSLVVVEVRGRAQVPSPLLRGLWVQRGGQELQRLRLGATAAALSAVVGAGAGTGAGAGAVACVISTAPPSGARACRTWDTLWAMQSL
jgi:hypothetical protein